MFQAKSPWVDLVKTSCMIDCVILTGLHSQTTAHTSCKWHMWWSYDVTGIAKCKPTFYVLEHLDCSDAVHLMLCTWFFEPKTLYVNSNILNIVTHVRSVTMMLFNLVCLTENSCPNIQYSNSLAIAFNEKATPSKQLRFSVNSCFNGSWISLLYTLYSFYFSYELMLSCWNVFPEQRPSFTEVSDELASMLDDPDSHFRLTCLAEERNEQLHASSTFNFNQLTKVRQPYCARENCC